MQTFQFSLNLGFQLRPALLHLTFMVKKATPKHEKCLYSDLPDLPLKRVKNFDTFQPKEWYVISYFVIEQHVRFLVCAKTINDCPKIDYFLYKS